MSALKYQLKIFSEFKCMGGCCPESCCEKWSDIRWTEAEINRIKNHECSPELHELIEKSFRKKPNGDYTIAEVNGSCPFLDEKKYCRIQIEMGHENLSRTCQTYPRKISVNQNVVTNSLNCSCVAVLDMLLTDPYAAKLVEQPFKESKISVSFSENYKQFFSHPELRYRTEIFRMLYDVIYDKSYSAETGITLGALAMQKISQFAEKKQADRIPEVIKAITPQLKDRTQIEKIEQVKPNYALKFAIVEAILSDIISTETLHNADGSPSAEKYAEGERKFAEAFAGREYAMRNLFINLMMDTNMPCMSDKHTLYENYCYFVFCASAFKYLSAVSGYGMDNIEEGFKYIIAMISRNFCHNTKRIDLVLARMKQYNCTSPAYLASLIK